MGMQVCGYLRFELAKVPVVVVQVDEPKRSGCPRASRASWSAENLARGLMRLSGHVQLQIPASMPGDAWCMCENRVHAQQTHLSTYVHTQ
jgi:hypothetical protein